MAALRLRRGQVGQKGALIAMEVRHEVGEVGALVPHERSSCHLHQRANQEEHHARRARNSYGQARALSNNLRLDNTMGRTNCVVSKSSCTNPGQPSNGSPGQVRQGKMSVVVSCSNARTSL